ncbi:response regulator [Paenibacillus koleovorans]|uniref:response regulator n=1 Tax=Paenibacillus koleovorans TaxID=121608 RepID=UPI000FD76639|nr:response regulator [Paenibacillus koleovorans]
MHTIMIVEDAAFMREIIKDIVIEMGFDVVAEATNGEDAVKMYSKTKPDLVTMDITMPVMNGVDALRKIKAIDPSAKVIVCSAMSHQNTVIEALSWGAKDFIAKPVQKERVKSAVKNVLNLA